MRLSERQIIEGAQWLALSTHSDARGTLTVFDTDELPFEMRRYFFIDSGPGVARGEHANSSHQLIASIRGGVTCELDNGTGKASVHIEPGTDALWVTPGVWLRLHSFAPDTLLGVATDKRYADTRYWMTPQPQLVRSST
jgi:dTDP-4-dehydrorhamnose 3,5-epimerase-like enzyme